MEPIKLLTIGLLVLFVSCGKPFKTSTELQTSNGFFASLTIYEFDSCEYIVYKNGYSGSIAHKGNCKYCEQRRKQEIQEITREWKE